MRDVEITRPEPTLFIDVSAMIEPEPSKGHLYEFHSRLVTEAGKVFGMAVAAGPVEYEGSTIFPLLKTKHFKRHLGTFFQKKDLNSDLKRVKKLLDSRQGLKILHFFEGGFRELTLLSEVMQSRSDVVAIFNFFNLDPWISLTSKSNPLSIFARKIIKTTIEDLSPSVIFTVDTPQALEHFQRTIGTSRLAVYPLFSSLEESGAWKKDWSHRRTSVLFTPRTKRELALVVRAMKTILEVSDSHFSVDIASRWNSKISKRLVGSLESVRLNIRLFDQVLPKRSYDELFYESKIVALPYLDKHYVFGSSGKVLDSIAAQCWVVAPQGSSAGKLVESLGAGKTFDGSPDSLARAILGIDLSSAPNFASTTFNPEYSLQKISEMSQSLCPGKRNLQGSDHLQLLPFLVGPQGIRWAATHMVAPLLLAIKDKWKR